MKLQFDKKDSIYKIFKTINKLPSYRTVQIFIDPQNPFFRNPWWGKQIMELIEQRHLHVTFLSHNKEVVSYLTNIGATVKQPEQSVVQSFFKNIFDLLFKTKNLHNQLLLKQNYLSYFVIVAEAAVIAGLLYALRSMVSPNATVHLTPAYHVEDIVYNYRYYPATQPLDTDLQRSFISIPYTIEHLPFEHTLTVNVQNITYTLLPAKGRIEVTNTLTTPLSLLGKTKFVTDEGILFEADEWFTVPPAQDSDTPGKTTISVTAVDYEENGEMIGERGNIAAGTRLLVRNLPESMQEQAIRATSVHDFAGGATHATGTVISEDIEQIEASIISYMEDKKKEHLQEAFDNSGKEILMFNDLISLNIQSFITNATVGATTAFIEGKVTATIDFPSIKHSDLEQAVMTYLGQRPSENLQLLGFDTHSITFYDLIPHTYLTGVYLIPTKMNAIRGYNFDRDHSNLLPEIRSKIAGMTRDEALQRLRTYEDIAHAEIRISPPRYTTLPQVKSRISFRTAKATKTLPATE